MADLKKDMETLLSVPVAAPADKQGGGLTDEREAFEKHFYGWDHSQQKAKLGAGYVYKNETLEGMWQSWQARAVLARVAPSGKIVGWVRNDMPIPEFTNNPDHVLLNPEAWDAVSYAAPQPSAQQAERDCSGREWWLHSLPGAEAGRDVEQPAEEAPSGEPIYQLRKADGSWIDQTESSYRYNLSHGHAVRIVYAPQRSAQQAEPLNDESARLLMLYGDEETKAKLLGQPAEEARGVDELVAILRAEQSHIAASRGSCHPEWERPRWDALQRVIDYLAAPAAAEAQAKPVAWIRFRSDGGIEGPILDSDSRICDVRRKCWTPLYTGPQAAHSRQPEGAALTDEDIERQYKDGIHIASGLPRATCPCGFCVKHRASEPRAEGLTDTALLSDCYKAMAGAMAALDANEANGPLLNALADSRLSIEISAALAAQKGEA